MNIILFFTSANTKKIIRYVRLHTYIFKTLQTSIVVTVLMDCGLAIYDSSVFLLFMLFQNIYYCVPDCDF